MLSGPEIHGVSPIEISVRCLWDFSMATEFRHGESAAAREDASHAGELGWLRPKM